MSNTENSYSETDLGNVSPNPRGEYDQETSYEYLDLVNYKGGSYLYLADLGTTATGIAPAHGKNTDTWQLLTLPGDLTPEYTAMHDDVVNKAKQIEDSRAAVEQSQQEIEAAQADVQQLHSDTVEAAQEASDSRDSAAGYAQAAETSRRAASESEKNVNAQLSGFDTHVAEKITEATQDIESARQTAVSAVTSQQETSVQAIAAEGEKATESIKTGAETVANDRQAVEEAAQTAAAQAQEVAQNAQTVAANTESATKSAESAQTSAENAAKSAESVQAAVDQIAKNTQDVASLKKDISNKITKFYASNLGETHLSDSDNGKIMDMMIYGKSEQFTTTGKNLLKIKDVTQTTRGITVTSKDGILSVKGTATETGWAYVDIDTQNFEDGVYIASLSANNNSSNLVLASKSFEEVCGQNVATTFTNAEISEVCFIVTEGKTYNITDAKIQLELGSEATSYEPYTGGIPSPNPDYPQEIKSVVNPTIKVVGKNLLNATLQTTTHNGVTCANNGDGTYTLNGTSTADVDFYIYGAWSTVNNIHLDSQKTYIVKKSGNKNIQFYAGMPDTYTTVASLEDEQIKNQVGISFFICRILSGVTLNNFTIYPQIEEGSVSTDFQPYHEQTVTLPYTLNAIPVSSGGNVAIDGQQYVADYVDVERGKIVRRVGKKILTGEENWELGFDNWETYPHCVRLENIPNITHGNTMNTRYLWREKLANTHINSLNSPYDNCISISDERVSSAEEFKNELKKLVSNGTPLEVYYKMTVPQDEELTSEQIQALQELKVNYPVTNISVNSEQLNGYTVFNYPISMQNGWNYVKQQLNDNRDYIYDMDAKTQDIDTQAAEAYVNSEYAVALTELEV